LEVNITLTGKRWEDIDVALDEVVKSLKRRDKATNGGSDRCSFRFSVEGEEDPNAPHKAFRVASVSANRNSFGLTGMVLVAKDGEAWQVGANDLHKRTKGTLLRPRLDHGKPVWTDFGFEIPERLKEDAPPAVVKEVWK